MPKLINEHTVNKIRNKIPFMARNIHEGRVMDILRNVGNAGKEFIKDRWKTAGREVLNDQERIRNEVLYPRYAEKLGVNTRELHRLLHEVPHAQPSAPLRFIPDPNHPVGSTTPPPLVANPHWRDEMAKHQVALDDWNAKQKALTTITGINKSDRNIGRTWERIQGGRADPRNRTSGQNQGLIKILQSRI